jgi:metallophosphoesterase superfamily enzyme
MRKFIVYNDVHVGGGHEMDIRLPRMAGDNIILNGDNIDLTGCAHKDVDKYFTLYRQLRLIHGRRMIRGNHGGPVSGSDGYVDGNVIFRHGHHEMWKENKVIKWQHKTMGSGWLKRKILVPAFDKIRHFRKYKIKKRFKDNIIDFSNRYPGIDTMVFGHAHPNEVIDIKIDRMRVIILPRGKNEVLV